ASFMTVALLCTPVLAEEGDFCPNPKQMDGFKTCADIAKAEAEGELIIYATNPEAAELKVLNAFHTEFPKIKTNYTRLQAGPPYAKVTAERQAKRHLGDILQISATGLEPYLPKEGRDHAHVSP